MLRSSSLCGLFILRFLLLVGLLSQSKFIRIAKHIFNNSYASPNLQLRVELGVEEIKYSYSNLRDMILCITHDDVQDCRQVEKTIYDYNMNTNSHIGNDVLVKILAFTPESDGVYTVMDRLGYNLFDELTLRWKKITLDFSSSLFSKMVTFFNEEPNDEGKQAINQRKKRTAALVDIGFSHETISINDPYRKYVHLLNSILLSESPVNYRMILPNELIDECHHTLSFHIECCHSDLLNQSVKFKPIHESISSSHIQQQLLIPPYSACLSPSVHRMIILLRLEDIDASTSYDHSETAPNRIDSDRKEEINVARHYFITAIDRLLWSLSVDGRCVIYSDLSIRDTNVQLLGLLRPGLSVTSFELNQTDRLHDIGMRSVHYLSQQSHLMNNKQKADVSTAIKITRLDVPLRSSIQFRFNYGHNEARMRNVCLLNRTTILLFPPHNDSLMNDHVSELLTKSYSGLATSFPQSTGWTFIEVNSYEELMELRRQSSYQVDKGGLSNEKPQVLWSHGNTIAMSPPYTPSIFHSAQVLMTTLFLMNHINLETYRHHIPRNRRMVDQLLLVSTPHDDFPWTLGLAVFLQDYMDHIYGTKKHTPVILLEDIEYLLRAVTSFSFESGHWSDNMTNGTCERAGQTCTHDPDNLFYNSHHGLVCFDRLTIEGAMELRVPFAPSTHAADSFRNFLSDRLGLKEADYGQNDPLLPSRKRNCLIFNPDPNCPLNVTIFLRPKNRWLVNMEAIIELLFRMGLLGPVTESEVLQSPHLRVMHLESLSFAQQVYVMQTTDILITPHGAAIQNLMFMKKHSAVIEIFTSPWYEPGYQATALMFGIHYSVIPHPSMENVYDCIFPAHCMDPTIPISAYPDEYQSYMQENTTLMVHRRSLGCFGMRLCNCEVDLAVLEVALWQASQSVRLLKRTIFQRASDQSNRMGDEDAESENRMHSSSSYRCFYKKAYEYNDPLDQHSEDHQLYGQCI